MDFLRINKIVQDAKLNDVAVKYRVLTNVIGEDSFERATGECWISSKGNNILFVDCDNDKGGVHISFEDILDIRILPEDY